MKLWMFLKTYKLILLTVGWVERNDLQSHVVKPIVGSLGANKL